jgi:hypothetical protein
MIAYDDANAPRQQRAAFGRDRFSHEQPAAFSSRFGTFLGTQEMPFGCCQMPLKIRMDIPPLDTARRA